MHNLAGIITTPKSAPLYKRMSKFCDYYGTNTSGQAFCDGWGVACIDKNGDLHTTLADGEKDLETYHPTLGDYRNRNIVNPYYGETTMATDKYTPAILSTLISPGGKVYQGEEVEEKLEKYRREHPEWGIYVIQYHEL